MLTQMFERLEAHQLKLSPSLEDASLIAGTSIKGYASVLVAITDEDQPQVILTRRSTRLSSHAGQIAFPGGKQDDEDQSTLDTALREAYEEVGLVAAHVNPVAQLKPVMSINKLAVTPWVAIIPPDLEFVPNPDELDVIFTVPLTFFLEQSATQAWETYPQYKRFGLPVWEFEEFVIWGLTAYIIADLLNICFDAGFDIQHRAHKHKDSNS